MPRNKVREQVRKELAASWNRVDDLRRLTLGLYEQRSRIEHELEVSKPMDARLLDLTNRIQRAEQEYADLERRINALRASLVKKP